MKTTLKREGSRNYTKTSYPYPVWSNYEIWKITKNKE